MRSASSFLDVARALAVKASHRITELRRKPLKHMRKADKSLVTNADYAADKIIRGGLAKAFPKHAILTEENGLTGSPAAEYIWVVDPVDGTVAYAEDRPGYSVMIGLLRKGRPYAGVVVDPRSGEIFEAQSGQGTFLTRNGIRRRVHVSLRSDLDGMPVITSTDFPLRFEEILRPMLPGHWVPALNSVGIKVGVLVQEQADLYINHRRVHFWDTCAPQAILEEAGGTITFWDGAPVDYPIWKGKYRHTKPTLASNGTHHQDVLGILKPLR